MTLTCTALTCAVLTCTVLTCTHLYPLICTHLCPPNLYTPVPPHLYSPLPPHLYNPAFPSPKPARMMTHPRHHVRVLTLSVVVTQNALGYHGNRGMLSSLVGWISGSATPSFIEGQSMSGEVRVPDNAES